MKDLVETIVKAIVDAEDKVSVKEIPGDSTSIIEIKVLKDAADKRGHSIRIFVRDAAMKEARVIRKGGTV